MDSLSNGIDPETIDPDHPATLSENEHNIKPKSMDDIKAFNDQYPTGDKEICTLLAATIDGELREAERKIWHRHPVWFLDGNPIVGYSRQKAGWRLMFWSGADFGEDKLIPGTGKFKDASIFYTSVDQVDVLDLQRWLALSREIQWDYKNVVKRKGILERLK